MLLFAPPLVMARSKGAYPHERVAEFVVDKLDLTSVPAEFRPKHKKSKKTLSDYGYLIQNATENDALLESPGVKSQISIKILEQRESGLYIWMNGRDPKGEQIQRVLRLQRRGANALLKSRVASKEFASCPAVGGGEGSTAQAY